MRKIAAKELLWQYLKVSHQYGRLIKMPAQNACENFQEVEKKKEEIWWVNGYLAQELWQEPNLLYVKSID